MHRPDILVCARAAPGEDVLREPPSLVVEVASARTREIDWRNKLGAYGRDGAPGYWIADLTTRQLTTFRNVGRSFAQDQQFGFGKHRVLRPFTITVDLDRLFS